MTATPVDSEFIVNAATAGKQISPSVTALGTGFLVTWTDMEPGAGDASLSAVRGQIFDAARNPVGGPFLVNTQTNLEQTNSGVVELDNGNFVVIWADTSGTLDDAFPSRAVHAKIFDSTGGLVADEFLVNTTTSGNQIEPSVTALSGGGFVVTWRDETLVSNGPSVSDVKAKMYSNTGGLVLDEFLVNTSTSNDQQRPDVAALNDGGFVIVWQDESKTKTDTDGTAVFGQRYSATGVPDPDGEFQVNTTATSFQWGPVVTGLTGGGFVVSWYDWSELGTKGVELRGQIYDATGATVGSEFTVNTTSTSDQMLPDITALNNGGFVVTWTDFSGDGSLYGVRGQVFTATGVKEDAEFLVNTTTQNYQDEASVTAFGPSGFVVAWTDYSESPVGDAGAANIRAQVFETSTSPGNTAPDITSNGGGPTASINIPENTTAVTTVTATDADSNPLTYAIVSVADGGAPDAAKFQINPTSGVLQFIAAPDFESSTDVGGNNVYDVTVSVSDGIAAPVTQTIAVSVTNVDEPPMTTSSIFSDDTPDGVGFVDTSDYELGTKFTANQNGSITALQYYRTANDAGDTDNRTLNLWTVSGTLLGSVSISSVGATTGWQVGALGAPIAVQAGQTYVVSYGYNSDGIQDAYAFSGGFFNGGSNSSPDGVLTAPASGGSTGALGNGLLNDNVGAFPQQTFGTGPNYWVDVVFDYQSTANTAPTITSNGGDTPQPITINENTTLVTTVTASDPDVPPQTLTFSKAGGEDAALFTIDPSTGVLSFTTAPDYEAPPPAGATPGYQVTVQVSDGNGGIDTQNLSITVQDATEGTGNSNTFGGSPIQVSYVFGTVPGVAATADFGPDAIQTVTPSSAPGTLDVTNLPEPDLGNGSYGLSTVDFGSTTIRIEFPLDASVWATTSVDFAPESGKPYNGVLIQDFGNNLAAIRSASIVDQAGFSIPLTAQNLTVTADSIFLNVNNPTDGTTRQQARLVDADTNTPGTQSSFVTLSVDFVDEEAALLSGSYWSGIERTNTPVFVTYSFPTSAPPSHANINPFEIPIDFDTFQAFSVDQQNQARAALQEWANASGITLLEVAPGQGQLNFALYDFTVPPNSIGAGGGAYNPFGDWNGYTYTNFPTQAAFFSDTGDGITDASGDVFINAAALPPSGEIPSGLLLHEIGHALGLKHPFETTFGATGVFHDVLTPALDTTDNTVMSYTLGSNGVPTALRSLDVLAVQAIYGTNAQDGSQVASWAWDSDASVLTQTGFDGADDIMRGVSVSDVMTGGTGNDRLFGLGGNDTQNGGDGNDELWGGFGNDTLTGGAGFDTFYAMLFDESGTQSDVITDFNVNQDVINLSLFSQGSFLGPSSWQAIVDVLLRTDAPDQWSNGNVVLKGMWGGNAQTITLTGVTADWSSGALVTTLTPANVLVASSSARNITGTGSDDTIFGSLAGDILNGGAGNDRIAGDAGADVINGGAGNDYMYDADGMSDDSYSGGDGIDVVEYTTGTTFDFLAPTADELDATVEWARFHNTTGVTVTGTAAANGYTGGRGADTIYGGGGNDWLQGQAGADQLFGQEGNDRLEGGDGADTINGGAGNDNLYGGGVDGAADKFVFESNWGSDQIWDFEDGLDKIDMTAVSGATAFADLTLSQTTTGTFVRFGPDQIFLRGITADKVTTADFLFGSSPPPDGVTIVLNPLDPSNATLVGSAGNDFLSGSGGNNKIYGYEGNDILSGEGGNDSIYGGDGADDVSGGAGSDRMYDEDGMSGDSYSGGDGIDVVEYTIGTTFNFLDPTADTLDATVEWARFHNTSGVTVTGTAAANGYTGGIGADTIYGGGGNDWLQGQAGADQLFGQEGNDRLEGGAGADTINGGAGNDNLFGGGADGAVDTFVFNDNWGSDQIWDFEDGVDKIDLTAVSGLTSFEDLTLIQNATGTFVQYNADQIFLRGITADKITAEDFVDLIV